ncbi:MAG: type III-B CRISPR module RAMP protein Cmr6 [Candidatus Competibacter sp.]|nr:type III-B CRISPR module RAMP protein Cmr6 [Candidatus Competibacter sp.]MDG4584927.1 type III-B CRISPR module RAMP protein Cmr6 [Candidatus Competibacter sp.]
MAVAAVPSYVKQELFAEAPPGHRFGLYFQLWNQADWLREADSKDDKDKGKQGAIRRIIPINHYAQQMARCLFDRQKALANILGDSVWRLRAQSVAPFMTGLGNEHPLENGFSFLNPYGLPYLPGSGVKGVLRRAAEELALGFYGDTGGWDIVSLWWLFGFEPNSIYLTGSSDRIPPAQREEAQRWQDAYRNPETRDAVPRDRLEALINATLEGEQRRRYREQPFLLLDELMTSQKLRDGLRNRGALMFWDVMPEPAGAKLAVDIMTPHYGDYYQGITTPHDSGQPNPILFLTVPPGSRFEFFVQCDPATLPESLKNSWPILLEAAFQHAFEWLGFGAKTAVGYGQFPSDALEKARTERAEAAQQRREAEADARMEAERQKKLAAMSPLDRAIEEIVAAAPQGQSRYKAILNALKQGRWSGDEARQVAERIRTLMTQAGAWRIKSEKKKPEKDEPYQATLAVLAYLEGKK